MYRFSLAVIALLAVVGVFGLLTEVLGAQELPSQGDGTLTVQGATYDFEPSGCFIDDEGFTVAGSGYRNGERHWVSGSNVALDLVVGTEGPLDHPADDRIWLLSDDVYWSQDADGGISAHAVMHDHRLDEPLPVHGVLTLTCDS